MSAKQVATTRNKNAAAQAESKVPRITVVGRSNAEQVMIFLREYLKDHHARNAARRAGFSEKWAKNHSYTHLQRNEAYLQYLGAEVAKENAKTISIDLEPVLQRIASIAFANEADYLVIEPPGKDAKPDAAPSVRKKRLDELTREQMVAVVVFKRPGTGELDYKLRNVEGRLLDLAEHLGAFNSKLILEHRHAHMHAHLDLTHVDQGDLDVLEGALEKMLELRGRKSKTLPAPKRGAPPLAQRED